MPTIVRFILIMLGLILLINLWSVLRRLIPIMKRDREARRVREKLGVISVEAEVVMIDSEKLNDLDTQFSVQLRYELDGVTYYKDIVLLNRHSLRVGQKFNLLCDEDDPENATLQNGAETDSTGNLIFNFWLDIVLLIIDAASNVIDVILETQSLS
ncbi:MAG: hypothetical protein NC299_01480 [Lachnospiraceae bacterium]|nr:hypothetical protein [Ruminococcus sp.]MCM1274021.1 hypothetical protein [Lachnospiraceae bacterium]